MTNDEKLQLATALLDLYSDTGFGSPSKREVDLLIFHHITQSKENLGKTNYQLATALKIPEARIKTYRLASALKYQTINSKAILGRIVQRLLDAREHLVVEDNKIEISLEDPIEKRELENFLKTKGHFAEYTFNSETLRIAPIRLLELITDNIEDADTQLKNIINQGITDQDKSKRILKGNPNKLLILERLRTGSISADTIISLALKAADLLISQIIP